MRALSAGELLDVWETAFAQGPTERALALLAVVYPDTSRDSLAALSIGQRDAMLLMLREKLWGQRMEAVVVCPNCRERLEFPLDTRQFLSAAASSPKELTLAEIDGYRLRVRPVTSMDIVAAVGGDPHCGYSAILRYCVTILVPDNVSLDNDKLPESIVAAATQALADADPLADIQIRLSCPSCEHSWSAIFDIVSYLWTELEVWAWRILSDVHTLARAYGWPEQDILSLSPTRRQFYLEMAGA